MTVIATLGQDCFTVLGAQHRLHSPWSTHDHGNDGRPLSKTVGPILSFLMVMDMTMESLGDCTQVLEFHS